MGNPCRRAWVILLAPSRRPWVILPAPCGLEWKIHYQSCPSNLPPIRLRDVPRKSQPFRQVDGRHITVSSGAAVTHFYLLHIYISLYPFGRIYDLQECIFYPMNSDKCRVCEIHRNCTKLCCN